MDATQFAEGEYINADIVRHSPTKLIKILGAGKSENTEYGLKLTLPVKIDDKPKIWRPNRDSVRNIINVFGKDTESWIGKQVDLSVITIMGKDSVVGVPRK